MAEAIAPWWSAWTSRLPSILKPPDTFEDILKFVALYTPGYNLNFPTEPTTSSSAISPPLQLNYNTCWCSSRLCPGPLLYTIYTLPFSNTVHDLNISFHQYADDTSLFPIISIHIISDQLGNLRKCTDAIFDWHLVNWIRINPKLC